MRAFFIGTVQFSREMLTVLLENNELELVGIATKSNSSFNSDHSDLSDIAVQKNIPFKYVKDINAPHIIEWITQLNPDVIFCLGWSSLISTELLRIPKIGIIGYHPAELPYNKGRHPQIWAMVLGLSSTASTFFFMDEGADSGDIVNQAVVKIDFEDNALSLYEKLTQTAKIQLAQIVYDLLNNSLITTPQEKNVGNHWRKRSKSDGRIDWRMRSIDIYNLVRALSHPYPGAHFDYLGSEIKVWHCFPIEKEVPSNFEPGKVLEVNNGEITVKTGDGAIVLIKHELSVDQIEPYLV